MMQTIAEISDARNIKINRIEAIKDTKSVLEFYNDLELYANGTKELEDNDKSYFLKCFGVFEKDNDTFMLRIRIPAGQLSTKGATAIGEIAKLYGQNHIDITTRQQIELRNLKLQDIAIVIRTLKDAGLSTFQTGIDNFRNIVTSSFDGLGCANIIDTLPLLRSMQAIFLEQEEWIGVLPRKFNTAILGTKINDCNIYGHDCCFIVAKKGEKIGFNLYLGGRVGHQSKDSGLFVEPKDVLQTFNAVINIFQKYGFRDNRNKNRLHFLLEAVGMDLFVEAIKEFTGLKFNSSGEILATDDFSFDKHGVFELDDEKLAINFAIPSGLFSGSSMIDLADLSKTVEGEIRLSVEQSFYIVCDKSKIDQVKNSKLYEKYRPFQNIYYTHQIACIGSNDCSFGVIPTKSDAIHLANYLQREVPIENGKVRFYWSGCIKGCGIHGVADIGFEGCKVKNSDGVMELGVNVVIGGKATKESKEARILKKSVPLRELNSFIKQIMIFYRDNKENDESFESFESRVMWGMDGDEILELIKNV
jgi:ferredoxin-nitrite reductase